METITTSACCPWNLSPIPTRAGGCIAVYGDEVFAFKKLVFKQVHFAVLPLPGLIDFCGLFRFHGQLLLRIFQKNICVMPPASGGVDGTEFSFSKSLARPIEICYSCI